MQSVVTCDTRPVGLCVDRTRRDGVWTHPRAVRPAGGSWCGVGGTLYSLERRNRSIITWRARPITSSTLSLPSPFSTSASPIASINAVSVTPWLSARACQPSRAVSVKYTCRGLRGTGADSRGTTIEPQHPPVNHDAAMTILFTVILHAGNDSPHACSLSHPTATFGRVPTTPDLVRPCKKSTDSGARRTPPVACGNAASVDSDDLGRILVLPPNWSRSRLRWCVSSTRRTAKLVGQLVGGPQQETSIQPKNVDRLVGLQGTAPSGGCPQLVTGVGQPVDSDGPVERMVTLI
jgi:hypothetical protein